MALFKIWYKGDDGRRHYEAHYEERESYARKWFEDRWPDDDILHVENVTANERTYDVASEILKFAKISGDPRVKQIATFHKGIAAVAVVLAEEYKHILERDHVDSVSDMAKKAFHLMTK